VSGGRSRGGLVTGVKNWKHEKGDGSVDKRWERGFMKRGSMKDAISNREFHIYGVLTGQDVTFIGCTKDAIPPSAVRLQTVSDHPEANWVKWCLRFRRTLKDRRGIDHP
jgi:hypothetical protein